MSIEVGVGMVVNLLCLPQAGSLRSLSILKPRMHSLSKILFFLTFSKLSAGANPEHEHDRRTDTAVVGIGFDANTTILGDYYNYWVKLSNWTFDLTRSA